MIEVAMADDHPLMREGVKKVLKEQTSDVVIGWEASNAGELLDLLNTEIPDIVILDITMPRKSGLDLLKELKDIYPKIPVLIMSMHPEGRFAIRAIKAGAWGYLNKSSIGEELVKAIRTIVTQNKRYITPVVADALAQQVWEPTDEQPHCLLSDREFQVFIMIVSGNKVSEIAESLSLSVQTVHTYKARLKKKMNMTSNAELARYAVQHNLID